MRTLVIDTATEACSVAVFDGIELIAGEARRLGRGHAEQLIPMIAALPDKGRAERIAVGLGPGSFTGVRVGLAAARALALAWRADLVGYPTLALVAAQVRAERGAQPVAVAMTAGHGEWFVQDFAGDGRPLGEVRSLAPDEAAKAAYAELVAGSQASALVAARGHGTAIDVWPDARGFCGLPDSAIGGTVAPLYGRGPDARLPT